MLSLNIIGAGKVGKSLGYLFARNDVFEIAQVFNLNREKNLEALDFIGRGIGLLDLAAIIPADITLLSVPDDEFGVVVTQLIALNGFKPHSILFHCSGAKSSKDLLALCPTLADLDIQLASIHPVRSFANLSAVYQDFTGTICSVEGSPLALDILSPAFAAIGAKIVTIEPENKLLYHAASVFASNYLVTLIDTAIATYCAAGLSNDLAQQMAQSLATKSLENVFALGASKALTGPIKRGDMQTVTTQAAKVQAWDVDQGALYQAFIKPTIRLSER
ncbi:Rossmann-like and DUF2520 domain-containing protein [Undibacterium sp.]|uniref:Rossmann-like and DUF2520 domain-containing protein n=1 Tax=Undibacterium sp. TaxID=1914977 RepID=UPI003752323D